MSPMNKLDKLADGAHPLASTDTTVHTPLSTTVLSAAPSSTPPSVLSATSRANPPRDAAKWTEDEKKAFNDLCLELIARMNPGQINSALQDIADRLKDIGYHKTLNMCRQQWWGVARFLPELAAAPSGPRVMAASPAPSNGNSKKATPFPSLNNASKASGQVEKVSPAPAEASDDGSEAIGHTTGKSQNGEQGVITEVAAPGRNKAWSAFECEKLLELANARREQEASDPDLPKLSITKLMATISLQLQDKYKIDRTPDGCTWTYTKLVRQVKDVDSAPVLPPFLSSLSKDIEAKLDNATHSTRAKVKTNSQDRKAPAVRTSGGGNRKKAVRFPDEHRLRLIEEAKKTFYPSDETMNGLALEFATDVQRIRMFFSNVRAGHYGFAKLGHVEGRAAAEYADMSSKSPGIESPRKHLKRGRPDDSINLDTDDDDHPIMLPPSKKIRTDAAHAIRSTPNTSTDDTPPGKVKLTLPRRPALPPTKPAHSGGSIGGASPLPKKSPVKKARHSTGQPSPAAPQLHPNGESWDSVTLGLIKNCDEEIASANDTKEHTLAAIDRENAEIQKLQAKLAGLTQSVNTKRARVGELDAEINRSEKRKKAYRLALESEL